MGPQPGTIQVPGTTSCTDAVKSPQPSTPSNNPGLIPEGVSTHTHPELLPLFPETSSARKNSFRTRSSQTVTSPGQFSLGHSSDWSSHLEETERIYRGLFWPPLSGNQEPDGQLYLLDDTCSVPWTPAFEMQIPHLPSPAESRLGWAVGKNKEDRKLLDMMWKEPHSSHWASAPNTWFAILVSTFQVPAMCQALGISSIIVKAPPGSSLSLATKTIDTLRFKSLAEVTHPERIRPGFNTSLVQCPCVFQDTKSHLSQSICTLSSVPHPTGTLLHNCNNQ